MRIAIIVLVAVVWASSACYGWDGYDWNKGEFVEVGKGNLVRTGNDIEVYHWGGAGYQDETVTDISHSGDVTTVDAYGVTHEYDMD